MNSQWDLSQTNSIEWTSVSTDPTTLNIVLVNHNSSPATESPIKDSVNTADGKYALTNFVASPGDKYTIKFYSTSATNSGQLAESQSFNVTKSGGERRRDLDMTLSSVS